MNVHECVRDVFKCVYRQTQPDFQPLRNPQKINNHTMAMAILMAAAAAAHRWPVCGCTKWLISAPKVSNVPLWIQPTDNDGIMQPGHTYVRRRLIVKRNKALSNGGPGCWSWRANKFDDSDDEEEEEDEENSDMSSMSSDDSDAESSITKLSLFFAFMRNTMRGRKNETLSLCFWIQ